MTRPQIAQALIRTALAQPQPRPLTTGHSSSASRAPPSPSRLNPQHALLMCGSQACARFTSGGCTLGSSKYSDELNSGPEVAATRVLDGQPEVCQQERQTEMCGDVALQKSQQRAARCARSKVISSEAHGAKETVLHELQEAAFLVVHNADEEPRGTGSLPPLGKWPTLADNMTLHAPCPCGLNFLSYTNLCCFHDEWTSMPIRTPIWTHSRCGIGK